MALTMNYEALGALNKPKAKDDDNVYTTPVAEFVEREGQAMLAVYIPVEDIAKSKPRTWTGKDGKTGSSANAGILVNNATVEAEGHKWEVDLRGGRFGNDPLFLRLIPKS